MKVELVTHHPYPDEKGELIPLVVPHFLLDDGDSAPMSVPFDPANRHYQEIKDWYESQKKPPFKFDFKNNKPD